MATNPLDFDEPSGEPIERENVPAKRRNSRPPRRPSKLALILGTAKGNMTKKTGKMHKRVPSMPKLPWNDQ